jgi:hypothetical protein
MTNNSSERIGPSPCDFKLREGEAMRGRSIVIGSTIVLILALAALALATDPFVGTWNLSVAKSKVSNPGAMPKSEILKIEGVGSSIKWTYEGIDAGGKQYTAVCSAKYDGKDYPMTGMPSIDTWALP